LSFEVQDLKSKYDNAVDKLKATKQEFDQQKLKLNYLDKLDQKQPMAGELSFNESKQIN
jgi:hypothetical protein